MNIYRAAFIGDNQRISEILASAPSQINQILELNDENGVCKVTPIFLAAIAGKASTVNLLLEKKASIAPQESGEPLLHWILASNEHSKVLEVVSNHCEDPAKLFLNSPLNEDSKSSEALTELLKGNGFVARDVASSMDDSFWLGENASIDYIKEQFNDCADQQVLLGICLGALRKERTDVVTYLTKDIGLDIKASIQSGTFEGCNAAVIAAIKGDAKIFPFLKQMGIKLNDPVGFGIYSGQTVAYIAAAQGQLAVLEFLHKNDYDINAPLAFGAFAANTPLYIAAAHGQLAVLEFLHKNQYPINEPLASGLCRGLTPAYIAAENGHVKVLEFLHKNEYDLNTPLASDCEGLTLAYAAAAQGQVAVLEFLHNNGYKINTPLASGEDQGLTPGYVAAFNGKVRVLEYLHKKGYNLNRPLASGVYAGETLAYAAAENGHVEVLEYLHKNDYDLNTPLTSGQFAGRTPGYAAACKGHVEVLDYLHKKGYDLNAPIASGEFAGYSGAHLAASRRQIAVLQYLHKKGYDINKPVVTGQLKGRTPAYLASRSEYIDVLNALQDLGVDLDVSVLGTNLSQTPGVNKLKSHQRIEIAYRQLKYQRNWFRENKDRFIREMEEFPVADWIRERSFEDIREIYQLYRDVGGKKTRWIADVVVHFANAQTPISAEEIRQLIALFDLTNYSLEDFVEATRPGPVLLTLLEALSQSKTVCENSDQKQLAQWISAVLQENGGDEEFWQKTQNHFQAIQKILKEKTTKTVRNGKGKGKGKGARPKDYLEPLWKKFESKIQGLNSSAAALTQSIDLKRVEVSKSFSGFLIEIDGYIKTIQEKIQVTAASDMDDSLDVEYIKAKTKKTEAVLESLFEKRAGLIADLEGIHKGFREMDFQGFKKVADLQQELNAVTTKIFLHCESHVKGFKEEIGELENRLFTELSELRQAHEFKRLQNTLLIVQMPNSHFSPYAGIERKALDNEASIWEERQTLLKGAKTTDELERIDKEAKEKWEALGASLSVEIARQLQPSIPSKQTRYQRIDQHKDEKIQRLKREKNELTQEIERLQQMPIRSDSPEKKLPVVEMPVKERLIKRLKKIAFISDSAAKALSMIEQEGKILSRVTEIEKFLALFKIEYQRTTGSHSTYSDGTQNVVIADHDGESKPYQVEDALKAVLDKLSGKKPS